MRSYDKHGEIGDHRHQHHIPKTEISKNITASLINGGIGGDGHTLLDQAALANREENADG
jgi:hypothetical protein